MRKHSMLPLVFVAESVSFAQPYSVEESENVSESAVFLLLIS